MKCHSIPASGLPHTSRLYADFLENFARVSKFYAHPPESKAAAAAARQVEYPIETRRAVVEILREQNERFGADAAVRRNLDRLSAGAVAVATGQQVGLFTGPAYSFYKALTAMAVAKQLSDSGVDAVPIFWMATEDHDLAEVNHSYWPNAQGVLERVELPRANEAGQRVGEICLGPGVEEAIARVSGTLRGPEHHMVERALRDCCRPTETFGSSFAKLMARFLVGRGIILLDPLDARLHRLAAPVYRHALEGHAELTKHLLARNRALDKAGYHAQVKVTEQSTLLFFNLDGQRQPLRVRNGDLVAGRTRIAEKELHAALDAAPEKFSANALLRPVVQDSLLPTVAYVAGPAEIAYFAQAEVVYRRLLGRMPVILPRAGFTLMERPVARLLKRYGLEVADLWRGRQSVRSRMERQFLTEGLARQFDQGEKAIERILKKLRAPVRKLDSTLGPAVDSAERKILYQFLKLRGKAGRAENFRTGVLDRHERVLLDALYPHHGLQERTWCLLSFLAAHGPDLLDQIEACAGRGPGQHHVLHL